MILREYLYVDLDIVRGLLSQLDSGIIETEELSQSKDKKTSGGVKGIVEHAQEWSDVRTTSKSMGDALFPLLEDALTAEGLLSDVSELIEDPGMWEGDGPKSALPPGRIVRITAPGYLIDARFLAGVLSGFATTHAGLINMDIIKESEPVVLPPAAKRAAAVKKRRYKELPGDEQSLESRIPKGRILFDENDDSEISGEFFRGIVQVARGMFAPGLHLMLNPEADSAGAITVRLQEGRQYLDTDPDVLFARYGVGPQYWTVVGAVGHHALPDPDMADANFMDGDNIRRDKFGQYVNRLGTVLGNLGFTDLPQAPGFSLIPWAVYRTIGNMEQPASGGLRRRS